MDARLVDIAASMTMALLESKKKIDISDLQLPWRPIYAILEKELFPKQRKTGLTCVVPLPRVMLTLRQQYLVDVA